MLFFFFLNMQRFPQGLVLCNTAFPELHSYLGLSFPFFFCKAITNPVCSPVAMMRAATSCINYPKQMA